MVGLLLIIVGLLATQWIVKQVRMAEEETDRIDISVTLPISLLNTFWMSPEQIQRWVSDLQTYLSDSVTLRPSWDPTGVFLKIQPKSPPWLAKLDVWKEERFVAMSKAQMVQVALANLGEKPEVTVRVEGNNVIISLPSFFVAK